MDRCGLSFFGVLCLLALGAHWLAVPRGDDTLYMKYAGFRCAEDQV
jgi:hypothetical protein